MYAVGRLGSYISRGVNTVSAPFHPFGGAVDIVVVEQQDGTFKSSPWYVRFGKFQGVLKAREKIVDINVNGEDANFHMFLDHTGGAYFVREVDAEDGKLLLSCTSSCEEMVELERRPAKCNSWNESIDSSGVVTRLEVSNGTVVSRSGFMGLVFGRNSVKENRSEKDEDAAEIIRAESLERAEIAADLLEVNWSTNLASVKKDKDSDSRVSVPDMLDGAASTNVPIDKDSCLLEGGATNVVNKTFQRQPTVYYEIDSSDVDSDGNDEKDNDTICVKSGGVIMQGITSPGPDTSTEDTSEVETLHVLGDSTCSDGKMHDGSSETKSQNGVVKEISTEPLAFNQIDDSAKEIDSCSTLTNISSSANDPISSVQGDGKRLQPLGKRFCVSEEVGIKFVKTEEMSNSTSASLDEEQFLFSDLDDSKVRHIECMEVIPMNLEDKEKDLSFTAEDNESVNGSSHSEFESPVNYTEEELPVDGEESREEATEISSHIKIPRNNQCSGQEIEGMAESLPNMRSQFDELDKNNARHTLGHSLDLNPKLSKWALLRKNVGSSINSDVGGVNSLSNLQRMTKDAQVLSELKATDTSPATGDSSKTVELSSSGNWGQWLFKRSRSMRDKPLSLDRRRSIDAEMSSASTGSIDGEKEVLDKEVPSKEVPKPKANKKRIRVVSPTTEELASLNLKEGRNTVTFTFSTSMLGKQQVDARIYLWRWDARIVITDVDGTITKSDVLGQFMPLVGRDWSQTGVAHLFSAIKENGYQLLFLSARAISQAGLTRQFLFNLKQDGKGLPDGPVVISPDGLFPSLFREVIRRAPHEFKIACLEDIRACFPSDRKPFYAGFGNRDTDEFSYLKVGIPIGKIFIINPKGEVVVNRCDNKSYTSLHDLVNGMFPPRLSSEQEDFNSWNYWKLPPPLIDL
ncbi:hypothetical protein DCAR_0309935 [Daucus carota subsp. sativus]|uniref:LNS2/PITP domain-containing protein n=1 Tax=Daucus carota subsp. sativus TaxID=79200 RepID=A0AAF1ASG2_DAUCS|nr:PREDICTED: phosphatidate phosphatase PAH1-like [Daucus carota subsp. sativus]WOG90691.1 hypothetical protein DCAR_0309935 [Daucus carota subsp. sativus]